MSKIAVVYWSGTGNTEAMANFVAEGAASVGAEAEVISCADFPADKAAGYDPFAFGLPRPWSRARLAAMSSARNALCTKTHSRPNKNGSRITSGSRFLLCQSYKAATKYCPRKPWCARS